MGQTLMQATMANERLKQNDTMANEQLKQNDKWLNANMFKRIAGQVLTNPEFLTGYTSFLEGTGDPKSGATPAGSPTGPGPMQIARMLPNDVTAGGPAALARRF